jgi:hypothetical protein
VNLEDLKQYARSKANAHPVLRTEIAELYELAVSEIDTGGSEQHECELAYHDIEELIKEAQSANRQTL